MPGLSVSVRSKRRNPTVAATVVGRLASGGLTADLEQAIRRGTDNAEKHVDDAAREYLPKRGGFADYLTGRTEVHRSKIPGGLRLTVDAKGTDAARINQGRLRHMVFGDREVWVTQTVRPGYADEGLRRTKVDVDRAMAEAVHRPGG